MKISKQVKFITTMLGIMGILSGCTLTSRDIIGIYQAKFPKGIMTIVILPDGTYQQTIQLNNGKILKNANKWKYGNSIGAPNDILFIGMLHADIDGRGWPGILREDWGMEARRSWGTVTLNFDDDLGVNFRKIH